MAEERVYNAVHESFLAREKADYSEQPVHCINIEVKDNHEDSLIGAQVRPLQCSLSVAFTSSLGDCLGLMCWRFTGRGKPRASAEGGDGSG